MRQHGYLFITILFLLIMQGCIKTSLEVLPSESAAFLAEDGGPSIEQVAERSDVLAFINPETNIVYVDSENEESFLKEFHASNYNNQLYLTQFGKQVPFKLKRLSEVDYSEKVLRKYLWLKGRKCELKLTDTCINTVGHDPEKSFILNGLRALCMKVQNKNKTCLSYWAPMIQNFYPEKGCKGTPAFSRVVVPVCDPINNPC